MSSEYVLSVALADSTFWVFSSIASIHSSKLSSGMLESIFDKPPTPSSPFKISLGFTLMNGKLMHSGKFVVMKCFGIEILSTIGILLHEYEWTG